MASHKDFEILSAIMDDKDPNKGVLKNRGTTRKEIAEITSLSNTKIGTTLAMFEKQGLVEKGLSIGRIQTYVITEAGVDMIDELSGGELIPADEINEDSKGSEDEPKNSEK
jgi:DNA-binding MarR family transcriptional regulator